MRALHVDSRLFASWSGREESERSRGVVAGPVRCVVADREGVRSDKAVRGHTTCPRRPRCPRCPGPGAQSARMR